MTFHLIMAWGQRRNKQNNSQREKNDRKQNTLKLKYQNLWQHLNPNDFSASRKLREMPNEREWIKGSPTLTLYQLPEVFSALFCFSQLENNMVSGVVDVIYAPLKWGYCRSTIMFVKSHNAGRWRSLNFTYHVAQRNDLFCSRS